MIKNQTLDDFTKRFLTGRINWWKVPRKDGIRNFGSIISMILYRKDQFQVELFIVPDTPSSFTVHCHPNVDTYEFPLSGDHDLFFNGQALYTEDDMQNWIDGVYDTGPVHIKPDQIHSGRGRTPYAFLSIQQWLNNVEPSSVGLDWLGEPSSIEHDRMLQEQVYG